MDDEIRTDFDFLLEVRRSCMVWFSLTTFWAALTAASCRTRAITGACRIYLQSDQATRVSLQDSRVGGRLRSRSTSAASGFLRDMFSPTVSNATSRNKLLINRTPGRSVHGHRLFNRWKWYGSAQSGSACSKPISRYTAGSKMRPDPRSASNSSFLIRRRGY